LEKYVSQFRKTNTDLKHFEINCILINKTRNIDEAFSKHFQSVYITSCPGTFPFIIQTTEVLSWAPILNSDVHIHSKTAAVN
jgi:hypothetical protein